MRRFWFSTEFWLSVIAEILFVFFGRKYLPGLPLAIGVNALSATYVIGRTLWKQNRGQFHSGVLTSELYFTAGVALYDLHAMVSGVPTVWAFGLLIGTLGIYNLCRGITKSIGVKTQVIHV